jgi:hypothetical protein
MAFICVSVSLPICLAKKTQKKSENTKDTIRKKNVRNISSVYLRIGVSANKITAVQGCDS